MREGERQRRIGRERESECVCMCVCRLRHYLGDISLLCITKFWEGCTPGILNAHPFQQFPVGRVSGEQHCWQCDHVVSITQREGSLNRVKITNTIDYTTSLSMENTLCMIFDITKYPIVHDICVVYVYCL